MFCGLSGYSYHWHTKVELNYCCMENLQCVAHMVEFRMHQNGDPQGDSDGTNLKINARDFFIPTEVSCYP